MCGFLAVASPGPDCPSSHFSSVALLVCKALNIGRARLSIINILRRFDGMPSFNGGVSLRGLPGSGDRGSNSISRSALRKLVPH